MPTFTRRVGFGAVFDFQEDFGMEFWMDLLIPPIPVSNLALHTGCGGIALRLGTVRNLPLATWTTETYRIIHLPTN